MLLSDVWRLSVVCLTSFRLFVAYIGAKRGLNAYGGWSGQRGNVFGVGKYCYVASAWRRARRLGAHRGGEGGAYCDATHIACTELSFTYLNVIMTSDVCLSCTSGVTREQRGLRSPKLAQRYVYPMQHHTWLGHHFQGQKVKGQGHQAAIFSAALTLKAAPAVSVGTYSAWETTATLRLLGGARGARAPTGGILCRHAHSLFYLIYMWFCKCSS